MFVRTKIVALITTCLLVSSSIADNTQQTIEGTWLSGDGSGWISIDLSDGTPVGTIAGTPDDPEQKLPPEYDELNPDEALRERALYGLTILSGFKADGEGKWKGGRIYDPNSGKTYKCKLKLVDAKTLEVRGYIGFALIGRTEIWTRKAS